MIARTSSRRRRGLLLVACVFFAIGMQPVNSQKPAENRPLPELVSDIKIPDLKIESPYYETIQLATGPTLLRAPDASLPFVTLEISFEGGTNAEAIADAGTLEAMTRLMEIGGAGKRSGDEIAETLSRLGARLSVGQSYDGWSVSLTVLKKDFAAGFELLSDVLLRPTFPADRLPVVQNGLITRIKQRNDDPGQIARRKLMEVLYGDARAGYHLQPADVQRLSIAAVKAEHKRRLRRKGVLIALSGDYRGLNVEDRCNELFDGLPADTDHKIESIARDRNPYNKKILLVEREAAQAVIMTGGYLPAHNDPDFFGLQTGNYILGGGSFNSRLMREIRARRGLAYYAYSYNTFRARSGTFFAGSGTRIDAAGETLRLMLKLIGDLPEDVKAGELDLAREAILNSLVFQYADPAKFLESEVRFRRHGMPENYLKVFAGKVRAMTQDEIRRVFRKHVRPAELAVVVVGPPGLKAELAKLRPVVTIEPETTGFRDRLK